MTILAAAVALSLTNHVVAGTSDTEPVAAPQTNLTHIPLEIPIPANDGQIYLKDGTGVYRPTSLNPQLQNHLSTFLIDARSPIAAIVMVDVKTGHILAMAQGRSPNEWGGKTHTALHPGFPAASVFKTIVTTAAFDIAGMNSLTPRELSGGCSHVGETGTWMLEEQTRHSDHEMSLRRAFAHSCNGFFAKIGVNKLGLGAITRYAQRFGWINGIAADFAVDHSPFHPPAPQSSSAHTVGRFAAGFGNVGLSAVHAASIMLTIAHRGQPMPLKIFRDEMPVGGPAPTGPIFTEQTADNLLEILDSSVQGGTASYAFKRGKYNKIKAMVGGKTGTLTGTSPRGLTTWFAGMAPVDQPEVVVASVVVLDGRWVVKGPMLAAEALYAYFDQYQDQANRKGSRESSKEPLIKTSALTIPAF